MAPIRKTPSEKAEWPPLLEYGWHKMDLYKLKEMCVDGFPDSKTRPELYRNTEGLLEYINSLEIKGELWIDGSFLTEKTDPEDIDVVLRVHNDFVVSASPELQAELRRMAVIDLRELVAKTDVKSTMKENYKCDFHYHVDFPEGHPNHEYGIWMFSYYASLFGWDREGIEMKGIAVIELHGR